MSEQFAFDLRLARRKSGYTQCDVARLLAAHQSVVSDLERGALRPDLEQIITLSLLYGRSFEDFFADVMTECKARLQKRVSRLPTNVRRTAQTFNRTSSIKRLKERLHRDQHGSS